MHNNELDMIGSNRAGADVYNPMVRNAAGKLLAEAAKESIQQVGFNTAPVAKRRVCFITLENKSMEELGDFKEHIKMAILEEVALSDQFEIVSDRAVTGDCER